LANLNGSHESPERPALHSYLKGVTYTVSRSWEMNYKYMYIFGLIRFKKFTWVAGLLKYIFNYFSLIENILANWIAVICG